MIEFEIHGKSFMYDDRECGIYKGILGEKSILGCDYSAVRMDDFVKQINLMSLDGAVEALTELNKMALKQSQWKDVPRNPGYPILKGPEPTPIYGVRDNIGNTKKLTDKLLDLLRN